MGQKPELNAQDVGEIDCLANPPFEWPEGLE